MRTAPSHSASRAPTFLSAMLLLRSRRSCSSGAHSANASAATLSRATRPSSTPRHRHAARDDGPGGERGEPDERAARQRGQRRAEQHQAAEAPEQTAALLLDEQVAGERERAAHQVGEVVRVRDRPGGALEVERDEAVEAPRAGERAREDDDAEEPAHVLDRVRELQDEEEEHDEQRVAQRVEHAVGRVGREQHREPDGEPEEARPSRARGSPAAARSARAPAAARPRTAGRRGS